MQFPRQTKRISSSCHFAISKQGIERYTPFLQEVVRNQLFFMLELSCYYHHSCSRINFVSFLPEVTGITIPVFPSDFLFSQVVSSCAHAAHTIKSKISLTHFQKQETKMRWNVF